MKKQEKEILEMVKAGDLVRYSKFPHEELHMSGIIGLVIRDQYRHESAYSTEAKIVDVIWNKDRGSSYPAGTICWEFPDELELIK